MSWAAMLATAAGLAVAVALAAYLGHDGDTGTATWDAARASGFVGYLLLWASAVTGVALYFRVRPGAAPLTQMVEAHRITSALALSFVLAHVLALLFDPVVPFDPIDGVVPFTTGYRPVQVGLGTIAQWLLAAVLASTALAGRIPHSWWRGLHLLSFPCYVLALLHSILSGTDSNSTAAIAIYASTASMVAAMLVLRAVGRGWTLAREA